MKISKMLHIVSVIVGVAGIITFLATILGGADDLVFGITKIDALLCTGVLILIATWLQLGTIHHIMLEKNGEII